VKVFHHHLYEYRKGLRNLILHTMSAECRDRVEGVLTRQGIAYVIYGLKNGNMNVFFGAAECVAVIRSIDKASLTQYTPEEDFILGTMLGYGRLQQCSRYLRLSTSRRQGAKFPYALCINDMTSEDQAVSLAG